MLMLHVRISLSKKVKYKKDEMGDKEEFTKAKGNLVKEETTP